MPRSYLVLTAVGPDRPGLVDQISQYVAQRDGNVEASRMATLGGEFASIMLISGEEQAVQAIESDVGTLIHGAKVMCQVKPTVAPRPGRPAPDSLPYDLQVHSMDHPGIVQAVSHHLAERNVNIEALDTNVESAPHTGTSVFHMAARLNVPASQNIARFRSELEALAEQLNVDIQLTAAEE